MNPERAPASRSEPASNSLTGRVAIVTGAGSRTSDIGNGRAAAFLLAGCGAKVLLLDAQLDALAKPNEWSPPFSLFLMRQ
ncbi:hypothetical protein AB4Z46_23310 [Variovorax sp. M-6]|uniref:hypothetical protein n=1 Tax=Variovorax sp. M-6 TaxID=3233041 RepID=UPI003F94A147